MTDRAIEWLRAREKSLRLYDLDFNNPKASETANFIASIIARLKAADTLAEACAVPPNQQVGMSPILATYNRARAVHTEGGK